MRARLLFTLFTPLIRFYADDILLSPMMIGYADAMPLDFLRRFRCLFFDAIIADFLSFLFDGFSPFYFAFFRC